MGETEIGDAIPSKADTIGLMDLLLLLWHSRKTILWTVLATVLVAIIYLHSATYLYTAELDVTPVQSSASNVGGKLGGLSGLASLAGVNLPQNSGEAQFELYVEGIQSRSVADARRRGDKPKAGYEDAEEDDPEIDEDEVPDEEPEEPEEEEPSDKDLDEEEEKEEDLEEEKEDIQGELRGMGLRW